MERLHVEFCDRENPDDLNGCCGPDEQTSRTVGARP